MQFNPAIPTPVVAKPLPLVTPVVQAALNPAVAAAQQTATPVRTQTVQAPSASGKADEARNAQTGTKSGQALDTLANAVNARTNGAGYGAPRRGMRLDVSV